MKTKLRSQLVLSLTLTVSGFAQAHPGHMVSASDQKTEAEHQTDKTAAEVLARLYRDDDTTHPTTHDELREQEEFDQTFNEIMGFEPQRSRQSQPAQGQDATNASTPTVVTGTPQRQAQSNADFIAPKPEPRRFASFSEMAADPEIRRLFKQWLGPGSRYVNKQGKFRTDLTDTRRNSYGGLARRGWVNCRIGKNGTSGFVRYGQAHNTGAGGQAMVQSRGGAWPHFSQTTPAQQGKYESYCELFNQLAPSFIDQGELEP